MRGVRSLAVAVLAFVVVATVALAYERVALMTGNSTYAHSGRLPKPKSDAN